MAQTLLCAILVCGLVIAAGRALAEEGDVNSAAAEAVDGDEYFVPEEYRLGPGDQIRVIVANQEDFSGEFSVSGSGQVALPYIGTVSAGGRTTTELQTMIAGKLTPDWLTSPLVSVEVVVYRDFYILGEVVNPGGYPYVNGMIVLNAIALAGGYTYRADEDEAQVKRAGTPPESEEETVGLRATIFPGDVVTIPERWF